MNLVFKMPNLRWNGSSQCGYLVILDSGLYSSDIKNKRQRL